MVTPIRPNPAQWLWYAFGGRLPARLHPWVLADLTGPRWVLRHVARATVQLSVFVVLILLVLPGPFWVRGVAALGGFAMGMFYSFGYMHETTEHRAIKAGFPAGTASAAHAASAGARDRRNAEANRGRREAAARRTRKREARHAPR